MLKHVQEILGGFEQNNGMEIQTFTGRKAAEYAVTFYSLNTSENIWKVVEFYLPGFSNE